MSTVTELDLIERMIAEVDRLKTRASVLEARVDDLVAGRTPKDVEDEALASFQRLDTTEQVAYLRGLEPADRRKYLPVFPENLLTEVTRVTPVKPTVHKIVDGVTDTEAEKPRNLT